MEVLDTLLARVAETVPSGGPPQTGRIASRLALGLEIPADSASKKEKSYS
jgi:hypothetical protein